MFSSIFTKKPINSNKFPFTLLFSIEIEFERLNDDEKDKNDKKKNKKRTERKKIYFKDS